MPVIVKIVWTDLTRQRPLTKSYYTITWITALHGKLENQESGIPESLEVCFLFPKILRRPDIHRRRSESYRSHPEHFRQTIKPPKIFGRYACTPKIIRGLPNNPKIPDKPPNCQRSPEYCTHKANHSQAQFFLFVISLFGPKTLDQSILVLQKLPARDPRRTARLWS